MTSFEPFDLPPELELGAATSATQIEGGDTGNSWFEWSTQPGRIADKTDTLRAADHWQRFAEDFALMAQLGIKHYRLSIEWSRIEPEPGNFNSAALASYRQQLTLLRELGIEPLVTLHHFSNPLWFERLGAFAKRRNLHYFIAYVSYIVRGLADLCSQYITINEPNVYAIMGYFAGTWPPGKHSVGLTLRVMRHLALCHIEAYRLIHEIYQDKPVKVGASHHLRIMEPYKPNPFNSAGIGLVSWIFQEQVVEAAMTGRFPFPIGYGAPLGRGRFYDFIGLNYYSRDCIRRFGKYNDPSRATNILGWEVYPEGLIEISRKLYNKYKAPIWITENGTCETDDNRRIDFIYQHLQAVTEAAVPIERYYYWSLIDNFEWAIGEQAPFGLIGVDFETQKREIKKSGYFFSEIIRNHGVTAAMIEKYQLAAPTQKQS